MGHRRSSRRTEKSSYFEPRDTVLRIRYWRNRSGGSGQTFALPTKKKVSEQMVVASALTYASVLKKGLRLAPVAVHSF